MIAESAASVAAAAFDEEEVMRALGHRAGRTRGTDAALAAVRDGMAEARTLVQPLILYADADLRCDGPVGAIAVPSLGLEWQSASLTSVLAGAERLTLFAGTVGDAVSAATRAAFAAGGYARAVVLDACGTAAIAALAARARAEAEAWARRRGFRVTAPYSPGYGDWPLDDQGPLLHALEARRIGLRESGTHYLHPEKSFCGLVGWVRGLTDLPQASGCSICFLPGCRYRRSPPIGRPGVLLRPQVKGGHAP